MDSHYATRLMETVKAGADPETLLHAAFDAVVKGDFAAFGELVTDDVELHIRGFEPMDGAWRGRDQVLEAIRKNFALLETQKPELEQIVSQGDTAALLMREEGTLKANKEPYRLRFVQWFNFADGKIRRIEEIITPAAAA